MNRKGLAWLYEELPDLVNKGVLSPEAADRLREYYGPLPQGAGRRLLYVVFGLIGAVMLGLGVILVLGHNWDQISRFGRLMIVLALLMTAQFATGLALWRKAESRAWLEGTAVFQILAVGAAIALIGQTYHLVDDFRNFIFVWLMLSLPLVYLLDVKGVAGMYIAGIMVWLVSAQHSGDTRQIGWVLLALILPYLWRQLKIRRYDNSTGVLSWLVVTCFVACFGLTRDNQLWRLTYPSLFAGTYFAGMIWFDDLPKMWQNPFKVIGLTGGLFMAYLLSFSGSWYIYVYRGPVVAKGEYVFALALLVLASGLAFMVLKRNHSGAALIGALPVFAWAGYLVQLADRSGVYSAILINIFLLAASISVIMQGVNRAKLSMLNGGMLMLSAVILLRFFDFSYSFLARGIAFIVLGLVFLAVNLVISRRKDGVKK